MVQEEDGVKTVSLQGRKMFGKYHDLAKLGYEGRVFNLTQDEILPETLERQVVLEKTGEFNGMTFWQKDEFMKGDDREPQRGFGDDLMRYLAA